MFYSVRRKMGKRKVEIISFLVQISDDISPYLYFSSIWCTQVWSLSLSLRLGSNGSTKGFFLQIKSKVFFTYLFHSFSNSSSSMKKRSFCRAFLNSGLRMRPEPPGFIWGMISATSNNLQEHSRKKLISCFYEKYILKTESDFSLQNRLNGLQNVLCQ